ncbi:MAG: hypothetical protein AAF604_21535 [Acidobacteriota bacterium]
MRAAQLYEEHFERIERSIRLNLARHGIRGADRDDYYQDVHFFLIEDEYRRVAAFRAESSFGGFIDQVVRALVRDLIRRQNGRLNRSSAAAQRAGLTAIELEHLRRQGMSEEEATRRLLDEGCRKSRQELAELWLETRDQARRQLVPDDLLDSHPAPGRRPGETPETELEVRRQRFETILQGILSILTGVDLLFAQLVFRGVRVTDIAPMVGEDRTRLYPKRRRLLDRLRKACEDEGLSWDQLTEVADWPGLYFDLEADELPRPPSAARGESSTKTQNFQRRPTS